MRALAGLGQFLVSAKPWAYSAASARLSEDSRSRDSRERFWPVSTNANEARPTESMIAISTMALIEDPAVLAAGHAGVGAHGIVTALVLVA